MDGKQIREVTPQGIVYLDHNGEEQFIDFAECYENYVKRRTTPEYWEDFKTLNHKTDADWDGYVEWVKRWKEVGVRDVLDLYIEFYTIPSIRFNFSSKDDYHGVEGAVRRARWRLFDMT